MDSDVQSTDSGFELPLSLDQLMRVTPRLRLSTPQRAGTVPPPWLRLAHLITHSIFPDQPSSTHPSGVGGCLRGTNSPHAPGLAACLMRGVPPAKLVGRATILLFRPDTLTLRTTASYTLLIGFRLLFSCPDSGHTFLPVHRVVGSAASLLCSSRQSPPGPCNSPILELNADQLA
jgi:hypothetical protein